MSEDNASEADDDNLDEFKIKFDERFIIKLINKNENPVIDRYQKLCCKVLQISEDEINNEALSSFGALEYPNLFIFIIESQNNIFSSKNQEVLGKLYESRPLIILQTSTDVENIKIFYKPEKSSQFVDIEQHYIEDDELYKYWKDTLYDDQELQQFEDQIFKKLSWIKDSSIILRFLRTLNLEEAFFGSAVLKVAENGSKLDLLAVLDAQFEDDGRKLNNQAQNYIKLVFEGDESEDDENEADNSDSERTSDDDSIDEASTHSMGNDSSQSVLLTAIQHSNKEIIDYLISYWSHLIQQLPLEHQIKISTTAYETNQYNVLCDLLDTSDFPFPKKFTFSKSKIDEKLLKMTEERMEFKTAIDREDFVKIDSYIDKNLSNKFIYSIDNNSALTEAIKARQFGVFHYLKSLGFQGESCPDILANLKKDEQKAAVEIAAMQRKSNIQLSLKNDHKSIDNLCGKSLIHNRKIDKEIEVKYRDNIRDWFKDIHKIAPEMIEVAASCEELKIIFDFESYSVESASLGSPYASGVAYSSSKWIFIGAKFMDKERQQKIKGVIAHELCHYVMNLVYENGELPYYKDNKRIEELFKEISSIIDKWSKTKAAEPDDECGGIISTVYRLYGSKEFELELIVRVVHILAHYDIDPAKSNSLQQKYQRLFDFWYNHVVPEMQNYLMRDKIAIRINTTVGLLSSLSDKSIEFSAHKDMEQLIKNKITIAKTNVLKLLLINIFKHLQNSCSNLLQSQNLFLEPEKIKNDQVWMDLKNLYARDVKLNVFIDCTRGNIDNVASILSIKEFSFILIASSENLSTKLQRMCSKKKMTPVKSEIIYKWCDLTENSQLKLLQTEIIFQNDSFVSLLELLSKTNGSDQEENKIIANDFSNILNDQLFNLIVDSNDISINPYEYNSTSAKKTEILYKKRNFLKKGVNFKNEISQEKLISINENNKYVLISDIAGSGKSWVVKNISKIIRKKTPTRWVTYVDMKQFIEEFKKQAEMINFVDYFVEKMLAPKTEFEAKIFKKLYKNGKVSIIFDGFDEIAPHCAEFVANLANLFEFNEGNQLWIVTRDYFEVNLQQKLKIESAYKLVDFTEEDGVKFIVSSWLLMDMKEQGLKDIESYLKNPQNSTEYHEKAKKIVHQVTVSENQSVGLPQLFSMIAESFKDETEKIDELKKVAIFVQFVNKMYTRWADDKGILRKQASVLSQHYEMKFMEIHQYYAILSLFPELIDELFPDYDSSEWSETEIIACGIASMIGSNYSFIHETFREYFVADFIFKNLKKSKITNLLIKVLTVQKYGLIRMFLNDLIDNYAKLEKIQQELEKHFEKIYEIENFCDIFSANQEFLAELLTSCFKKGKYENVKNLLSNNLKTVTTKTKNFKIFSKFTDFVFSFMTPEDLNEIMQEQKILHEIIASDLDAKYFEYFALKIEEKFGKKYVQQQLKSMIWGLGVGYLFYYLVDSQNLSKQKVQKFIEILQTYLNDDEIANLMFKSTPNEQTILTFLIIKNYKNFKPFFDGAHQFLMKQKLYPKFKEIVLKTDSNCQHILHWSAKITEIEFHSSVWDFIQNVFENYEDLKDLIFLKAEEENFLHLLFACENSDTIDFVIQKIKQVLSESDYQQILRSKGFFERNLIHVAAAKSKEIKIHQILWKEMRESCIKNDEFFDILIENDKEGANFFHIAVSFTAAEILIFMESELTKIASFENIKGFLLKSLFLNRNILQSAVRQNESLIFHETLWKIFQKYFTSLEMLELIKHLDIYNYNVLTTAGDYNSKEVAELTWAKVKEVLNNNGLMITENIENIEKCETIIKNISGKMKLRKEEKAILRLEWINNTKDTEVSKSLDKNCQKATEQNLNSTKLRNLQFFMSDQNIVNHKKLWENLSKKTQVDLTNLLFERTDEGFIFFHLLIIYNTADVVEFTINKLKENLNKSNFRKILISKGDFGRNLLKIAIVYTKELKVHQILWKELKDICETGDEFLTFFDEIDKEKRDAISLTILYSTAEIFEFLEIELAKIASFEKIRILLMTLGHKNRNILQSLVYGNNSSKFHELVWKTIHKYFNLNEILHFITHNDDDGNHLLLIALKYGTIDVIKLTWSEIEKVLIKLYTDTDRTTKIKKSEKMVQKYIKIKQNERVEENEDDEWDLLDLEWIKNENSKVPNIFEKVFQEKQKNTLNVHSLKDLQPFLHNSIISNHEVLWDHLFNKFKDHQELIKILLQKNKNDNNFLHLIILNNTFEVIELTFRMLKINLNESNYQKILKSKGQVGRNLLQYAVASNDVKTHQVVWKVFRDYCKTESNFMLILEECDQHGSNLIALAAMLSTAEILKFMNNELKQIKDHERVKKLLSNLQFLRKHLLQVAVSRNKSVKLHEELWIIIKEHFSFSEILQLIQNCDINKENFLLNAIKEGTREVKILTWIKVKEIILNNVPNDHANIKIIDEIFEKDTKIKELTQEQKELLKLEWIGCGSSANLFANSIPLIIEKSKSAKYLMDLIPFARDENIENHKNIWKHLEETLKSYDDMKELIFRDLFNKNNFLHILVIYNKSDIIEFTITKFKENLNKSDYREILKSKGQLGRNLLQHAAAQSKEVKTHQILWKEIRESCTSNEEFIEILEDVDDAGNSAFALAAAVSTANIFKFMIDELSKLNNFNLKKKFLKRLGEGHQTLFQSAASQNPSLESHENLWNIMKANLSAFEILNLILNVNVKNSVLLPIAINNTSNAIIEATWKEVKNILTELFTETEMLQKIEKCEKVIQKVLKFGKESCTNEEIFILCLKWIEHSESFNTLTLNNLNSNYTVQCLNDLELIAKNRNFSCHEFLWENYEKIFENQQNLIQLLFEKNVDGISFIFIILIFNTTDVFEYTLKKLKNILDESNYYKLLKSKETLGINLLFFSLCSSKEIKILQILWNEFLESCKSNDEFLDILKEVDDKGNNLIHVAASFSTSEIFKFVISEMENLISVRKLKELFETLGQSKMNLLQLTASYNKYLETNELVWEIIYKYFDTKEILELIKYCDEDGDNLLCNAVIWNTKEIVEFTWNQIKIYISTKQTQSEYLNRIGHRGLSLYKLSLESKIKDLHKALWVWFLVRSYTA